MLLKLKKNDIILVSDILHKNKVININYSFPHTFQHKNNFKYTKSLGFPQFLYLLMPLFHNL